MAARLGISASSSAGRASGRPLSCVVPQVARAGNGIELVWFSLVCYNPGLRSTSSSNSMLC